MSKKINKIVIVGGGFGGTYTFRTLHNFFHKDNKVQIILVNKTNYFLFTPLLHEVASGGILPHHVVEPIRKVLGCCLADFYQADAKKVSFKKRTVLTTRGEINYDYLVLALGSQANLEKTPGATKNCFTLKTLEDAQKLKKHFIQTFEKAEKTSSKKEQEKLLNFVVIGGGPTGVELSAEMSEFFYKTMKYHHEKNDLISKVKITLIQKNKDLLPKFSKTLRYASKNKLEKMKIDLKLGTGVKVVNNNSITLDSGEQIKTSTIIWTGGVKTNEILYDTKLAKSKTGKISVNKHLQIEGQKNVFALGDMAHFIDKKTGKEIPSLAQVATRQAKVAARNINQLIDGKPLKEFRYKHEGYLLSLGQWSAVGEIKNLPVSGAFVWWIYRTVYLSKLLSWQKKVKVAIDWTINIFSPRDTAEV